MPQKDRFGGMVVDDAQTKDRFGGSIVQQATHQPGDTAKLENQHQSFGERLSNNLVGGVVNTVEHPLESIRSTLAGLPFAPIGGTMLPPQFTGGRIPVDPNMLATMDRMNNSTTGENLADLTAAGIQAIPQVAGAKIAGGDYPRLRAMAENPALRRDVVRNIPGIGWMAKIGDAIDKYTTPPAEKPPTAPEPFRPNPNIARKSKYGGPAPEDFSPPSFTPRVIRSAPPVGMEDIQPVAPTPFKPNPNIARKSPFGGPTEPDFSPPGTPGRRTPWTPPTGPLIPMPEEITPVTPTPYKAKPGVVKTKFGGPVGEPGMPSSTGGRTPKSSAYAERVRAINTPAEPEESAPAATPTPTPAPKTVVPPVGGDVQSDMSLSEAHRYAHAQAQAADLPGSPAGSRTGSHDALTTLAKQKYGKNSWHELNASQMREIGDWLLEKNSRAAQRVPPIKP